MGDDAGYSGVQNPPSPYSNKNSKTPPPPASPPALPEIMLQFFVLASVTNPKIGDFIKSAMTWARAIWTPTDDDLKKFTVKFTWDDTFKSIPDKDGVNRRIDLTTKDGSPQMLKLVKDNFSNTNVDPIVPVFICEAAWSEEDDKGKPHDGDLRGYTLVRILPWFSGERAIFLFSSVAGAKTLAHEMSHWAGFTHSLYRDDPSNIAAAGGGGSLVDRTQYRRMYKWATDVAERKRLGTKA